MVPRREGSSWFSGFLRKDDTSAEDQVLSLVGGSGGAQVLSPPTDRELLQRGLGFHPVLPPDIVAEEIGAQVEALRVGTPQRQAAHQWSPTPPSEVQVAVAMARASAERSRTDQLDEKWAGHPAPVPKPLSAILQGGTFDSTDNTSFAGMISASSSSTSLIDTTSKHTLPPPTTVNGYSIGNTLPKGVSWRYVDVMNQK